MSVTVTNVQIGRPPGAERRVIKEVTFDNSYAEGGEPLALSEFGLKVLQWSECQMVSGSESEEWVAFANYDGTKIHLWSVKTGKEVAKEKDMSKVKVLVIAYGF